MRGRYLAIMWAVFLTGLGFYLMIPRTVDSITKIDVQEALNPRLTLVQKDTRGSEGVPKSSSDFQDVEEILSYFRSFEFRKPFRVNYDTIDGVGPSYDVVIEDSTGEIFRSCIAGDKFLSMNDKKGVWRNYIPKDDRVFDFEYLDAFYDRLS